MSVDVLATAPATVAPDRVPEGWVFKPAFPTPDLLAFVRDFVPAAPSWAGQEGPRYRVSYSPGTVAVNRNNAARREMSAQRQHERRGRTIDMTVAIALHEADKLRAERVALGEASEDDDPPAPLWPERPPPRQEITEWSRKSRSNMWKAFHEIDYYTTKTGERWMRPGRMPVMATLTYSGDWYAAAAIGRASKRHFAMLSRRWHRAWGSQMTCIWKLEFQRRGAPHYHLLLIPPTGKARAGRHEGMPFRRWLSHTWADVVNHPDPAERDRHVRAGTRIDQAKGATMTDPRRTAVYFAKHSAFADKEYQHVVPVEWQGPGRGPGRFWGYRGLRRLVHGVEVAVNDAIAAARLLRRWARAQGVTQQVTVARHRGGRPRTDQSAVSGLAGAAYADHRPRITRRPDGTLVWKDVPDQQPVTLRKVRRRTKRLRGGAGWVSVNDGAVMAENVGRWLTLRYAQQRAQLLAEHREDDRAMRINAILNSRDRPPP